jgi:HEAT repeats
MRTAKITLVSIITLVLVAGLLNTALARTNVSVGIGVGYPGYYPGGYGYYGAGWYGRHHRAAVIIGGYWGWPGYYPGYYCQYPGYYYPDYYYSAPPPVIVERPPVVVERPAVVQPAQPVQPVQESSDTQALYGSLRERKSELLKVLMIGDKEHRISAINELAGYSFDDNVRLALEKVLLSDTDPELRQEAAKAFGEVKNLKAIPALETARVQDSITDVRKEADLSIKKLQAN